MDPVEYTCIEVDANSVVRQRRQRLHVCQLPSQEGEALATWPLYFVAYFCEGLRKAIFFTVATGKLSVLGSRAPLCLRVKVWGCGLIASALLVNLSAGTGYAVLTLLVLTGHSSDEAADMYLSSTASVPGIILWVLLLLIALSTLGVLMTSVGFVLSAWHRTRSVVRKLVERDAESEQLTAARRTLWQHFRGVQLSASTTFLHHVAFVVDGLNAGGSHDVEQFIGAAGRFVDEVGDIVGILMLSGIGLLLFNKDAEAGDVSSHIRGLLHSAVLTSRATTVFEGHVAKTPGNCCVASFPGKFWKAWSSLTWKCEQGELSSACVFLPASDPRGRFGRHAKNPETPRKCWCSALYGDAKPWGCQWFVDWKSNVERAVGLGLDLVVVYFPGQAGRGRVPWGDLPTANLWNGEGLGGSQKAEVAYLTRQGLPMIEEDVDAFCRRIGLPGLPG